MCERPNCRNCKKRHHQSLCDQGKLHNAADSSLGAGSSISQKRQEIISQESATTQTEEADVITAPSVSSRTTVVLKTATALARGEHGTQEVEIRILLDCGSQRTYVTSELKERLDIKPVKTEIFNLNTFGDKLYRKQKCDVVS